MFSYCWLLWILCIKLSPHLTLLLGSVPSSVMTYMKLILPWLGNKMEQSFIRYISCKYFSPSLCLVFLFLWSKCIALQMILVIHQACDVFLNCCLYIALSFARLGAMHSPQFSITHFSLCRSRLSHSQLLWLYLFFVSPFKFQLLEWIPLYLPVAGPFWFWYHLYSRFPSCLPFMVQKHMVWLSWSVRLMMLPPPPPHIAPSFSFSKFL